MTKSLTSFLDELAEFPDEVVDIEKPVRPGEMETTALLLQMEDRGDPPAVHFKNPMTADGDDASPFSLISNVFASRKRCAIALGLEPDTHPYEVSVEYGRRAAARIEPEVVTSAKPPVHENVLTGNDADVGLLPIVKHFMMDLGPVLTMTHIMRAPEGFYDISFAKTFYYGDAQRMVVSIHTRDLSKMVALYAERDEPAPIINVLAHHPAFNLGSLAPNPWGTDDYGTLGSFLGEPLRLAPSVTWGDRFMVPADAEVIIEGEIPPGERDACDPFGEVARLYQAQCLRPVFNTKAITFRDGAVVQDIFSGFRDSNTLGALPKESRIESALRADYPNFHRAHVPDSSNGVFAAYLSFSGIDPEDARAIGRRVLESVFVLQCVVIVDQDIDVFDESEVVWAIHTYADLDRDFVRIEERATLRSGFGTTNWGGRLVIDATRPRDFAFGARSTIPDEVMTRVRLDDYLPSPAQRQG